MKKILLIAFLTAIFASGALGQSDWHSGDFHFSLHPYGDSLYHVGVTYHIDSAWQYGYSTMADYDDDWVLSLNLDGPIVEQGEWEIAVTAKQAFSTIANCMHADHWSFYYKLDGGNDSAGLVLEMSWDSTKWFNLFDSAELFRFFDAATHDLGFWNDIYPTPDDSTIITLPDGRKALGPVGDWYEFGFGALAPYTWAGAGSLSELHWRATFVNYSHQPVLFGTRDYMNFVLYWCEHLGIGEQQGDLDVNLYPNPVNSCSVIELPSTTIFPVQLIIFDPTGRIAYTDKGIHDNVISMSRMNLNPGIYMYNITDTQNKSSIGKFIVK